MTCRLSFALAAGLMKNKVRVVAMDFRGHGLSETSNDTDLSIEASREDIVNFVALYIFPGMPVE